jgi:hypothetical protein
LHKKEPWNINEEIGQSRPVKGESVISGTKVEKKEREKMEKKTRKPLRHA